MFAINYSFIKLEFPKVGFSDRLFEFGVEI